MAVRVAIAGLGFGAEFIPIYQAHPDAELVAVCQRTESTLSEVADHFGVPGRYTSFEEMIADPDIDAVHINTPIPNHAAQSVAALRAGKHVACTVPMATSLEECWAVVEAARESGRTYMMMETVVYSREFLRVRELVDDGTIGRIQFLRGSHHQEMAGWPGYWEGLPPMHYATHAVSPVLTLAGALAESVVCLGSGRISPELTAHYGSPFAVESALLTLRDSPVGAEVARSLFETAREYVESFTVFGSRATFEWEQTEGAGHVLHVGEKPEPVDVPDYAHLLPAEIARFTTDGVYDDENEHLSFVQGSGHGGSHPHLAHEFVRAVVEGRPPSIDAVTAANWTAVGICAHDSAMAGGARVAIPDFAGAP
ncbi:oxidoreductase domain protein [Beutenbergia cavernae DSM 12333]|uniref:Oxidoreductase domain protein n=1 Tax=Beutenbergia cavernae (strain ATCC BAA-8 / DSM 12333 / CCUG 43141 / JCM 11478 / NBRC 16432 / NCIMB 13614 / HKI 0122) TaxID=471853 RepID=C5BYW1_BEUC1|nr:Gfo/Idh/MocA family oxidoreductase [Beutenbergia cavernae]ACQ79069.1 oxidoreductase domain protein [Beutenbergia cavernae DSM 12333]